jgi:hypothetical protein
MTRVQDPPLLSFSDVDSAGRRYEVAGALASGSMVRLWHGVYLERSVWEAADLEGRHLLRLDALRRCRGEDYVFCDESAAVLWGLPLTPARLESVTVIAPTVEGGRSRGGLVKRASSTARDVTRTRGVGVTTAAQTVVDLARRLPFGEGLGVADHALRTSLVTPAELAERLHAFRSSRGARRARRTLEFADARAESLLESLSRATMLDLGAGPDELQRAVVDATGRVMRGDFWWDRAGLIGECDGRAKYEYAAYTHGRTAGEVLWDEKRREDAVRSTGVRVARWGWYESTRPPELARLLRAAGLTFGR